MQGRRLLTQKSRRFQMREHTRYYEYVSIRVDITHRGSPVGIATLRWLPSKNDPFPPELTTIKVRISDVVVNTIDTCPSLSTALQSARDSNNRVRYLNSLYMVRYIYRPTNAVGARRLYNQVLKSGYYYRDIVLALDPHQPAKTRYFLYTAFCDESGLLRCPTKGPSRTAVAVGQVELREIKTDPTGYEPAGDYFALAIPHVPASGNFASLQTTLSNLISSSKRMKDRQHRYDHVCRQLTRQFVLREDVQYSRLGDQDETGAPQAKFTYTNMPFALVPVEKRRAWRFAGFAVPVA